MKQLGKVLNKTSWAQASNTINTNSESVFSAVTMLENAAFKHKGYFLTSEEVEQLYPSAEEGSQAFVYNSSNPSTAPYDIYQMIGGTWADTGLNGGSVSVDLTKKQDTLVGYSESVSGGKATQVAIQGDTIALSGKVSLGNVDDMESAILMSSSQAGAAIAKANTLEQSMSALKSPVKPIHLNSQGKLELNIGKGLYVEDGKLCATGASSGGGGGTTLSEGQGIRIYNDTINVAYDIDTLRVNSCGGLTVNYGEGLTIKNGKLSAQTSVNAGNGLVQKGDALQVSVGTGLLVADDVYVNMGKGLATDNENKVNVNLDEQTLTTDSSGKIIVNKDSLIGNGLKQEFSKLAVNYGAGLALSNKAIVVNYGTGLDIQGGKLVSTVQGGKTYVAGDAIGFDGNNINVKYDGVTISTKGTTDRSLHVMLGSGLKQGSNGIDVAVGEGLAIGSDNKLYSTVSSGKTYTAGDGISISGENKISLKLGTSLESKCGYIQVAISSGLEYDVYNGSKIRVKAGDGITIPNTGEVRAHLSNGLAFDFSGAIKICDAVLTDISNLKDSKQDKLTFGSGLQHSNCSASLKISSWLLFDDDGAVYVDDSLYSGFQEKLTFGSGLTKSGSTVVLANNVVTDISNNKSNISSLRDAVKGKQDTLTLATGLEWGDTNKIQVKMNAPLNHDNCGRLMLNYDSTLTVADNKLGVRIYGIIDNKGGLTYKNKGLAVDVGSGLKIDSCQVVVDYGTGLKVVNNKLDVDTSKIAGEGIDITSDYKTLTIGTKAAQALAGAGLMAEGPRIKVKYGSGLTTNSCGGLIVDAEKLTVGNANHASCADVAHGITYTRDGGQVTHGGSSFAWYNVYHSTPYSQGDCIILNLRHSYYHVETASVTFAINVGYGNVNITQLGASPKCLTYNKIRVRWVNSQDVFIDVLILSHVANSDIHYVQGSGLGTFTPPIPTSDTTGIISEFSIRPGYFYAQNASADVFSGNLTGTADKAIADSQGNKITTTYAKQFLPTNGLEINSDRQLFLPNLTSTLGGNAVDGSKNGAQRVLNLSCGAIQIKLSTGLAIDEEGYLYIQDKYVTK